jgi:L-lactate dehydrogenase complex protein LldE
MMDVSLMISCLGDAIFPSVGVNAVRVLSELGCRVDFPPAQTCCGQVAFNSGYWDDARRSAEAYLRAFSKSEYVISVSGSCAAMIRHHYPALFAGTRHAAEAESLAARTFEFSEFLVDVLSPPSLPVVCRRRATFHHSCHTSRQLGVVRAPETLLGMVEGLDYVPLAKPAECCGFGGTFSIKLPDISAAMVDEKVDRVLATGAELLVGLDMSCLMNIEGRLRRRGADVEVKHLAQILGDGWQA